MTQLEALMQIAKRDGGTLTPAAVIEAARPEGSPLHGAFTWDDTEAAKKWRVHEAQSLIRECRVKIDRADGKGQVTTYAFIGLSGDRDGEAENNPYRIAVDVAKSPDLLEMAVADVVEQLKAFKRKYEHLKRLERVWVAIDEL